MVNMDHLYSDPDWMLQAGLGDIEFEQDMYDDIMYGKPAHLPEWGRDQVREQWPSQWEPLADYDELALMGLRKHTMEGPMRYIYDDEQKKKRKQVYDVQGKDITGYMGQVDVDDPFDPDDNPRTRMDIDLKKILRIWDPSKGPLQDFISAVYRHEYKHPLWDQHLGIREKETDFWGREKDELSREKSNRAFREKYQTRTRTYGPGQVQHIPIYATGALYGQNPYTVRDAYKAVGNMGQKELGWGGNLMRTARHEAERAGMLPDMHTGEFLKHDQHPHRYPNQGPPGRDYNTGGLASLML